MSKVNNRKDIRQKEELQAKFQLAISQANSKVLSWLKPPSISTTDESLSTTDAALFLSLPVISLGSGLSLSNEEVQDENDIHTIGDFINGTKKISTLSKKKRANTLNDRISRINNRHKINKNDSKATVALKNKMRNSNRDQVRNTLQNNNKISRPQQEEDEDEDEREASQRSVKKGSNLLFDSRMKKRK